MKIAIVAAEISGDLIASALIKELKNQVIDVEIEGMAGDKMVASGCVRLWNQNLINVLGISDVIKKLVPLLKLRSAVINYFLLNKPNVFIGVDAPDFNFFIEKNLKNKGVKTVHFISPSIWAWRQWRIKKIKKSTDLVLCLFPFEVDFYQKNNQKALFVGHPLAESLTPRKDHKFSKNILLMPGSRFSEVKLLLPPMLLAVSIMTKHDSALKFHLALANDSLFKLVKKQIIGINISTSIGDAHLRIATADLVLVASGTATLEVALIGVPMVVVYKLSIFNYCILRSLVTSKYISLPNIIADKLLVPELIQSEANGKNIAKHAMKIISSDNRYLIEQFNRIHSQLKCNSNIESVKAILKLINE